MKKILITGANGNIGSYITDKARHLLPQTELITTIYSPEDKSPSNGVYAGDLRDPAFVNRIFQDHPDIDCIIHAAASSYNTDKFKAQPFDIFKDDTLCLLNVLENSPATKKKIILLSSVMVYESVSGIPFTEVMSDKNPAPITPYGLAKFLGERAVQLYCEQNNCDFTIWRLFNVISPLEDHTRPGAHVYVDFYRKLFIERIKEMEIFGDGRQVRCFTWVEDIADAVIKYLNDPRTSQQTINLGGNEPKTLIELFETLLAVGKKNGLLPQDYLPMAKTGKTFSGLDVGQRIPSLEKIQELLDWKAPTNFYTMLEKFIAEKQHYVDRSLPTV